ncbi:ash family protein [Klebsiella pneumoniae subsp. pneumoniae]|nr:ash family protein [Klebsiella pneumoniae subsp. pneumoniae]
MRVESMVALAGQPKGWPVSFAPVFSPPSVSPPFMSVRTQVVTPVSKRRLPHGYYPNPKTAQIHLAFPRYAERPDLHSRCYPHCCR